jgi:hypothetical protein
VTFGQLERSACLQSQKSSLGHHVIAEGIRPLPDRVAAIHRPRPTTVKQLHRRFVPARVKILRPLTDSLKGGLKATATVECTLEMKRAFADAKAALCMLCWLTLSRVGS